LRFGIESADEFFAVQLPFIVDTFGIDIRQIMHLELLGDGRSGSSHVAMCISFEDNCPASMIEACVHKIYNTPALPPQAEHSVNETIRERLIDFLLLGPPAERSRFLRTFKRLMQRVASRTSPESTLSAGFVS